MESSRKSEQVAIDAEKSAAERNRMGQYATPYPLAVDIARAVLHLMPDVANIDFGEPACGSGAFYSALRDIFPHDSVLSATGIELDPLFANAASRLWTSEGLTVVEGDFTCPSTIENIPPPNLILTNPPYVRHHHIGQERKPQLREIAERATGIAVNGLAGLYVYFLLTSHTWLRDDGIAAWLIPSEFMDVKYGTAVKRYLTELVTLEHIHRFNPEDVQFQDALVSSAVVVFRKAKPTKETRVTFSYGGTVTEPTVSQIITNEDLKHVRKWTTLPARLGSRVRTGQEQQEMTLGQVFKIQRGIATGANSFFIMERSRAAELGLPPIALRPILPSPRSLKQTIVLADSDGFPVVEPQLVLLDTDLPEEQIREEYPALWSYLATARNTGILDTYILKGRKKWYRQEQRRRAPFLCTYMGRSKQENRPFRFIWNQSNASATNVYLMLFPREGLARILEEQQGAEEQIYHLLNELAPHDLRDEGRIYGGGLHKIEPNELANIPALAFADKFPTLAGAGQLSLDL